MNLSTIWAYHIIVRVLCHIAKVSFSELGKHAKEKENKRWNTCATNVHEPPQPLHLKQRVNVQVDVVKKGEERENHLVREIFPWFITSERPNRKNTTTHQSPPPPPAILVTYQWG